MTTDEARRGKPGRKSRDDILRAKLELLLVEAEAMPVPSELRRRAEELQRALDARRRS
ncbi:MAG: hypothetical protein ACK4PN_16050 [Allorhizobium sp.]